MKLQPRSKARVAAAGPSRFSRTVPEASTNAEMDGRQTPVLQPAGHRPARHGSVESRQAGVDRPPWSMGPGDRLRSGHSEPGREEHRPRRSWPRARRRPPTPSESASTPGVLESARDRRAPPSTRRRCSTRTSTWNCTPQAWRPTRKACTAHASLVANTVLCAGSRVTSAPCHCSPSMTVGADENSGSSIAARVRSNAHHPHLGHRHRGHLAAEGVGEQLVAEADAEEGTVELGHPSTDGRLLGAPSTGSGRPPTRPWARP